MALHSQAPLLPYSDTSISNAQLQRLYRPKPIRPKWLSRRLVVASAAPHRKEPSKEISLDQHDLMALQFGRLLGESKEKTVSKVLRRKVDPGSTYIGIEKKAKGGKGLISNTDFAVKVEHPTRASGNASTLSPDLPRLTSPPSRQNGSYLPKLGSKLASYADTEEIMLDDSLLRKPSSTQASRSVLPPSTPLSSGVNNVKMLGSEFKSGLEEDSEDLERLRRPSMAKEQEAGKIFLDSSDQVNKNTKFSSQKIRSEVSSMLDNSDSMEVSKLEFQRLLDKSFNSSSVSSLPNLASPPATRNNSSRESVQTNQQASRLKLSSPKRPQLQTLSSQLDGDQQLDLEGDESLKEVEEFQHKQNVAPALPHLSFPPSRDKVSVGTFVQPAGTRNTATQSSMKRPTSDALEEPLLRKPKDQASDNVNLSSMQHSEGFYNLGDDEPLKSSKTSFQQNLDKPSAVPHLAAPPSRHKGSFGTFVAPGRPKIRGVESPSKEPVDEVVDESLLRKPSHLEKERYSMDSTSLTEANTAPLSFSTQMQLEDKIIDDSLLRRPSMEADTTQADVKISDQLDGLKQEGDSQLGGKASQLRPQADLPFVSQDIAFEEELLKGDRRELLKDNAQSSDLENSVQVLNGSNVGQDEALSTDSEQEPEPVFKIGTPAQSQEELSGLDGASQVNNDVSSVSLSGGLQDVGHSSGVKRVKGAALKKPVRVSSSDSKVYASEGKSVQLDSSQDSGLSSDVKINSNATGENVNLDIASDLKTLQSECEAEESMGSQSLVEPISVACFWPEPVSVEDQERDQATHEQLTAAIDQTNEILLDEAFHTEAAKEESTDNLLQQSKKMLRKPSQLTHADLSTQHSEQMDLQTSNTKLHQAKEEEEKEWARAEALLKSKKEQVEVKLIGSNSAGLFVSFGCLMGFLPSFELSPKRGLIDFTSWAQKKGIDLSLKDGSLKSIVIDASQYSTVQNVENSKPTTTAEGDINELKNKYKEEISKLMSSFVGEKTKVIVKLLDKSRRRLKFSEKEADPGCREHVQKKADLMAELKLGDVVTCEVKSITPIGVFVEVDGVPALIHHSEVSWNTRVEPASLLNIGQVIKAKVCRLDRTLQRINLSLKQMQTDPLKRTLESVVGDSESDSSMCELEAIQSMDVFWPELEDLIKKLEKMDQISNVSRGRCLYSAAFAPTFQVLISTPQSNGYKLLARYGNKIQEILVDTTLDRDKMKDCIRICTFSDD